MNSGIYKITNLITKDFYIGSAINFYKRKHAHFSTLKTNTHKNPHLQNAYNKYKKENFIFEIIAKCPVEYLLKLEQWFINTQNPHYNICKVAGNTLGVKWTDEQKENCKISHKKKWDKIKNNNEEFELLKIKLKKNLNKAVDKAAELSSYKIKIIFSDNSYKFYNSIRQAALDLKCSKGTILNKLKNTNLTPKKYNFKVEHG